MSMQQVFKDIPGYEGYYQISTRGDVYSLMTEKILSGYGDRYGYVLIGLCRDGKRKMIRIHQLVALTFLPTVEGKEFINHKNGNKSDNRLENLEWVTKSENSKHSFEIGTQCNKGVQHPGAILTDADVIEIRKSFKKRVVTRQMLADKYGVKPCTIKAIIQRKIWAHVA